jgi:hypothetical protein
MIKGRKNLFSKFIRLLWHKYLFFFNNNCFIKPEHLKAKKSLVLNFQIILLLIIVQIGGVSYSCRSQCIIKPGIGIDNIELSKSTSDDVQTIFGKKKLKKKHHKPGYGGVSWELNYPDKSLTFHFKKDKKGIYELSYIDINKRAACETVNGIQNGDTKDKLIRTFGEPVSMWSGNGLTYITYRGVRFLLLNNQMNELIVEQITIQKEDCTNIY